VTSMDGIIEAVSEFASRAAEKLRHQESVCGAIHVFFATSPFRQNDRQHQASVTIPLVRPTSDTRVLVATAASAVRQLHRAGFNYAKAGVMMVDLQQADAMGQGELDLFGPADADAAGAGSPAASGRDRARLMDAMDTLNRRFGRDAVRIGSATVASSLQETRAWAIKQERRSPRYTTRWDEMPVVRA